MWHSNCMYFSTTTSQTVSESAKDIHYSCIQLTSIWREKKTSNSGTHKNVHIMSECCICLIYDAAWHGYSYTKHMEKFDKVSWLSQNIGSVKKNYTNTFLLPLGPWHCQFTWYYHYFLTGPMGLLTEEKQVSPFPNHMSLCPLGACLQLPGCFLLPNRHTDLDLTATI